MRFRVWPNGTVQDVDETPYNWMSDDYLIVEAADEDEALFKAEGGISETITN